MLINKPNEEFFYDGQRYYIGQLIVGTDTSEYEGLFGTITEVRDGDDKDTDNKTPDIYCSFEAPAMPYDIKKLESVFSDLYGESKTIDDITLDEVIMAPEMIESVNTSTMPQTVYVVIEKWAHRDDCGACYQVTSNLREAKRQMRLMFNTEMKGGLIDDWLEDEDFIVESSDTCYEIYHNGYANAEHYMIYIEEHKMLVDSDFTSLFAKAHRSDSLRQDFISHVKQMAETVDLTDEQYERLLADPSVPSMIETKLFKNDAYWEAYWQSVSEVARYLCADYSNK